MSAHILIIEHDPTIAGLFEELLADQGYRTTLRLQGWLVLGDIIQLQPDLILADVPPLSIEDRFERLLRFAQFRQRNSTPIIVTTTSSQAIEAIMHTLADQQVTVLFKPFELEELYTGIRNFLGPEVRR